MKSVIFLNGNIKTMDAVKLAEQVKAQINLTDDYIIAVDGGYRILSAINQRPDALIGDFDSLQVDEKITKNHLLNSNDNIHITQFDRIKDFSDFEGAITAIDDRSSHVLIYGIVGGRSDHSLMNLLTCRKISQPCVMLPYPQVNSPNQRHADEMYFFLHSHQSLSLTNNASDDKTISLFSFNGEASCVSTQGLKYPLDNDSIEFSSSLGLSNEMLGSTACIKCHKGDLLVICQGHAAFEFNKD